MKVPISQAAGLLDIAVDERTVTYMKTHATMSGSSRLKTRRARCQNTDSEMKVSRGYHGVLQSGPIVATPSLAGGASGARGVFPQTHKACLRHRPKLARRVSAIVQNSQGVSPPLSKTHKACLRHRPKLTRRVSANVEISQGVKHHHPKLTRRVSAIVQNSQGVSPPTSKFHKACFYRRPKLTRRGSQNSQGVFLPSSKTHNACFPKLTRRVSAFVCHALLEYSLQLISL